MNCPKQPKVPVYLFVGGALGILKFIHVLYDLWRISKKEKNNQNETSGYDSRASYSIIAVSNTTSLNKSSKFINRMISFSLLVWFGFGNYWVYN